MPLNTITRGATFNQLWTVANYPAGSGWSLQLILNPRAGGTVRTVNSFADGDGHRFLVSAANTSAWTAGDYGWQVWAINGTERYLIEQGQVQVLESLDGTAAGTDTRSEAQKVLHALKAAKLEFSASGNLMVGSYSINGRTLTYRSIDELDRAIRIATLEVAAENRRLGIADGRGAIKTLKVCVR